MPTIQSTFSSNLKNQVFLIGYNTERQCIYNVLLPILEYYETEQPWDSNKITKAMKLTILHGYLFGEQGELIQEFETQFDINTGTFKSGWRRDEDGMITKY